MASFSFHIEQPARDPIILIRACNDDHEAVSVAQRMLSDWPDCEAVLVKQDGELIDRLKPAVKGG